MSTEEKILRENRRKNFARMFKDDAVSPRHLASLMKVDESYISQLKNGFRPITFEVARQIEKAFAPEKIHMSLDNPPEADGANVSALTDKELADRVSLLLREMCSAYNKPARGDFYKAMLQVSILDARQRGFSEARIRFIAKEFLQ